MPKACPTHITSHIAALKFQSLFPPVDTSRRGFLTNAAALAAAGTAMALAAPVAPAEAAIVGVTVADDAVDPFLVEIKAEIDENLTEWLQLEAECKIRDRAVKAWETRNPLPRCLQPDEPGYSPTARSDWQTRRISVMRKAQLGTIKSKRDDVATAFTDAVQEFAAIKATNLSELIFKVETGIMMDSRDGIISRAVLFDIVRLRRAGEFQYDAAALSDFGKI